MTLPPSMIPVSPTVTKTASYFIDDVNAFSMSLGASIKEKGHKGEIYVDFPDGKSLRMAQMNAPAYAKNSSTVLVIGHDEGGREVHVLANYEQLSIRVVIIKTPKEAE